MTKTIIMRNAWKFARNAAAKFGGEAIEYIAGAMKKSWAMYKAKQAEKGCKVIGFAEWFIDKKFGHKSMFTQIHENKNRIKKETKKAYLIESTPVVNGEEQSSIEFWAPKSVCI
ncbi:hypothetical protein [Natribacillus halophilus]|uniref:Bacteriophage Gp111 protein n=1 Tax=Natribacillus halophilus TaxID=549003 RepID=A0A1G8RT62_9BACI|nr:hypothetical protein [Natribacillus halophilus]SDJ19540.1 bacteriophage Gp111 protein [Natribacillus halophilus]